MAIVNTKKYIDLADLTLFKELNDSATAAAIATAEARSLHTVAIDGTTLKFYREEEPVGSATPAYSVSLPQQDLSNYLQKIASATGGKVVASLADGTIEESAVNVADLVVSSDLAAVATSGDADDLNYDNTTSGLTATDVQAAIDELADASAGGVASKTVYITESSGGSGAAYSKRYSIYQGDEGTAAQPEPTEKLVDIDIPKDMVVESGEVVDVVYDNGHLYEGSTSGTDVTEEIKGTGGTATSADAGKYIKLTIANSSGDHLWIAAKDLVDIYTSGSQSTDEIVITIDNNNQITAAIGSNGLASAKVNYAVPDVYTEDPTVTLANWGTKVAAGLYYKEGNSYVQVTGADDFDENETYYTKTAAHSETVQHALERIDSAIGGGGSVDQKIADAIGALDATASQTAGADGLALSVTEVDGKITAISGSIAANTYDEYGTAAGLIEDLDAVVDSTKTAIDGSTDRSHTDPKSVFALQAITETSGLITSMTVAEVAQIGSSNDTASDNTIYGAKAYADSLGTNYLQLSDVATESEIRALFTSSQS